MAVCCSETAATGEGNSHGKGSKLVGLRETKQTKATQFANQPASPAMNLLVVRRCSLPRM